MTNMLVSQLLPGLENSAYLIASFIFIVSVIGAIPHQEHAVSTRVSLPLFEHVQRRVFCLYAVFFTFVVIAKIIKIPLWFPAIVFVATLPLATPLKQVRLSSILNSLLFVFLCLGLLFKLGSFGALISKWDGNAHQTIISQLTHYNTLLLNQASRLDDRFLSYSPMLYYPYLAHGIIASYAKLLAEIGIVQQPAWLAISVALPVLTASALVVASMRIIGTKSALYQIVAFLFLLSVPATIFTEAHHGSFARSCSSVLAIGLYTQCLGKFDVRSATYKASIGMICFALHLQGAIFFALYYISELIVEISINRKFHIRYIALTAAATAFGTFAFFAGNSIYTGGIDTDILHDLFTTWRHDIIPDNHEWFIYSIRTLFQKPNNFFGITFFILTVIGIAKSFKTKKYELFCAAVFITLILIYAWLLLNLPNSRILVLLARPFVGVISRLYEAAAIMLAIIAAAGLLAILDSLGRTLRGRLANAAILLFYAHSAYSLQGNLSTLAGYFDTLKYDQLTFLSGQISKKGSHALLVTTDLKFSSIGNGNSITSYLSYYDCPFPTENSSQCKKKIGIARELTAIANENALPGASLSNYIAFIKSAGFDQIFVIAASPQNTGRTEGKLYRFDDISHRFVLLSSTVSGTEL